MDRPVYKSTEQCCQGEAHLCQEFGCISIKTSCCTLRDDDGRSCWKWCHIRVSALASFTGKVDHHQGNHQINLGKRKSTFLSPGITSILANMVTLYISPPNKPFGGKKLSDIQRMGHLVHLIVEIFLYSGYHLMRYKYLQTLGPFCEVHPHIHITNPLLSKSQICWLNSQNLFPTVWHAYISLKTWEYVNFLQQK